MDRRDFIKQSFMAGMAALSHPVYSFQRTSSGQRSVTILHTNDTLSRIDPFPSDSGKFADMGGISRRATLVRQIKKSHPNVLLLDAGNVFGETPYFDRFGASLNYKLMSEMGYDAAIMGNRDFKNGIDGLVKAASHAAFPLVCSNYLIQGAPSLEELLIPHLIKELSGVKIGIFGLGINLERFGGSEITGPVRYRDPVLIAESMVRKLRKIENCDLVICLSHLGYSYDSNNWMDDRNLAHLVKGIDLIVGGHTRTFLTEPEIIKHPDARDTVIAQVGFGGVMLGHVDFIFNRKLRLKNMFSHNRWIESSDAFG